MARLTTYLFGAGASCSDGASGQVSRVIMDPAAMTVTHLVIEPDDPHQPGRLAPLDLLDAKPGEISLRCTAAEFFQLNRAEKTQSPPRSGRSGFGLLSGPRIAGRLGITVKNPRPQGFTYDLVPAGEVAMRGGDPVHAIDGIIGNITGVVTDTGSRRVAYLLLHERHLLGKNIAVPVSAVARIDAGIQLEITRQDVKHLPPVNLQHSDR